MRILGSVQAVRGAMAAEAREDLAALEARLAEAERDAAAVDPDPDALEAPEAQARRERARRRAAQRLDVAEWEAHRAWLEARERWMEEIAEAALARLEATPASPSVLARLADEALPWLPGETARVVVSPRDVERLGADWRAERARVAGKREVEVVAGAVEGGLVVETPDGRVGLDQTWRARARRRIGEWRPALARIFAAAGGAAEAGRAPRGRTPPPEAA